MMLAPVRARPRAASRYGQFPAPVRGLNLRDNKAKMKPDEALILDNYFPEQTFVRLRGGSDDWATGFPAPVETIMEWSGPAGRKLFAAAGTQLYDASVVGAIGAADVTGLTNARWQHCSFSNAGANFLVCCNGADDVRNYNGTSWTTPAITGVASASLNYVTAHKDRLWFVEKDSTKAWYLATSAIAGAATAFDLGSRFIHGGKLLMIGSMSQDSGSGPDDYLAFYSSNGDIVVYAGTDPASANTWQLVGTFYAGTPIGNRSLLKVGGDIALIGTDGIVSTQQMMVLDRSAAYKSSVSNRIDPALAKAFQLYGANDGWQGVVFPAGHMALVNVPVSANQAWQYAMNTQTGAWCRFRGLNARCWGLYNESLYFGSDDAVVKAETGLNDNGAAIDGDIQPAFHAFGSGSLLKTFKMTRPLFRSNALPTLAVRINTDYADEPATAADSAPVSFGPLWGTMVWGQFTWTAPSTQKAWFAVFGTGFTASPRLFTSTTNATIELDAIDVIFEKAQGVAV